MRRSGGGGGGGGSGRIFSFCVSPAAPTHRSRKKKPEHKEPVSPGEENLSFATRATIFAFAVVISISR